MPEHGPSHPEKSSIFHEQWERQYQDHAQELLDSGLDQARFKPELFINEDGVDIDRVRDYCQKLLRMQLRSRPQKMPAQVKVLKNAQDPAYRAAIAWYQEEFPYFFSRWQQLQNIALSVYYFLTGSSSK